VSTAPTMTANWEAEGSDQWTIPLGGGVGRVVHIGKQAINFKAAVLFWEHDSIFKSSLVKYNEAIFYEKYSSFLCWVSLFIACWL